VADSYTGHRPISPFKVFHQTVSAKLSLQQKNAPTVKGGEKNLGPGKKGLVPGEGAPMPGKTVVEGRH